MKTTTINNCTLYLADYRDVLPLLGKITAVVADPPYGNDYRQKRSRDKLVKPDTTHAPIVGNAEPFDPAPLLTLAPTWNWPGPTCAACRACTGSCGAAFAGAAKKTLAGASGSCTRTRSLPR